MRMAAVRTIDRRVLWALASDGRTASADARLVASGVEVRLLHDGIPCSLHVLPTVQDAFAWADGERISLVAKGWASGNGYVSPRPAPDRRRRVGDRRRTSRSDRRTQR